MSISKTVPREFKSAAITDKNILSVVSRLAFLWWYLMLVSSSILVSRNNTNYKTSTCSFRHAFCEQRSSFFGQKTLLHKHKILSKTNRVKFIPYACWIFFKSYRYLFKFAKNCFRDEHAAIFFVMADCIDGKPNAINYIYATLAITLATAQIKVYFA